MIVPFCAALVVAFASATPAEIKKPHPPPRIFVELEREGADLVLHVVAENELWGQWIPGFTEDEWYEPSDDVRGAVVAAAVEMFSTENPLTTEGAHVPPHSADVFSALEVDESHGYPITDVAVRYHVPEAREVQVRWTMFSGTGTDDGRGPGVLFNVALAGGKLVRLVPDEPEHRWWRPVLTETARSEVKVTIDTNPKRSPWGYAVTGAGLFASILLWWLARRTLAVGLAAVAFFGGAAWWVVATPTPLQPLTDEEAIEVFEALHARTYEAFDYQDEGKIYDVLDSAVSDDLLEELYVQIVESLVFREEGGAMSRIDSCEVDGRRFVARTGEFECTLEWDWRLALSVHHYGHVHQRVNRYKYRFDVAPREGSWKIVGWEPLEAERIDDGE